MLAFQINSNGDISEKQFQRKDIAQKFDMYVRDLRPVFSVKQLSTISPRGAGIIVNFWNIKMVIGKDQVFLFQSESKIIQEEFIPILIAKIQRKETRAPFELRTLESALTYAFDKLNTEFQKIESGIQKILYKLKSTVSDEHFEMLLNHKKHLNKIQISIKEMEETLEEILKDEEDIYELCLSKKKDEVEEVESILEHSWEQFEDLSHRIHELSENIDDTQEVITLKMANRRNMIIRFDLYATLITAVLSGLAVIVGAFGMNLANHLEKNKYAFLLISVGIFIFFVLSIFLANWYVKRKNLW